MFSIIEIRLDPTLFKTLPSTQGMSGSQKLPPRERYLSNQLVGNKLLNHNRAFIIRSSSETTINMGEELL